MTSTAQTIYRKTVRRSFGGLISVRMLPRQGRDLNSRQESLSCGRGEHVNPVKCGTVLEPIAKTGLQPKQLLTGLWLDCNMMNADRQTLLSKGREELWPISEDTLRRTVKTIRRAADQMDTTDQTQFSPTLTRASDTTLTGCRKPSTTSGAGAVFAWQIAKIKVRAVARS